MHTQAILLLTDVITVEQIVTNDEWLGIKDIVTDDLLILHKKLQPPHINHVHPYTDIELLVTEIDDVSAATDIDIIIENVQV